MVISLNGALAKKFDELNSSIAQSGRIIWIGMSDYTQTGSWHKVGSLDLTKYKYLCVLGYANSVYFHPLLMPVKLWQFADTTSSTPFRYNAGEYICYVARGGSDEGIYAYVPNIDINLHVYGVL